MGIHRETVGSQRGGNGFEQVAVEENAAREHDRQALCVERTALAARSGYERIEKTTRDGGPADPGRTVGRNGAHERAGVQAAHAVLFVKFDRIPAAGDVRPGQGFEPFGPFALIADIFGAGQQRIDAVEQAADAAGRRAAQPAAPQSRQHRALVRGQRGGVRRQPGVQQQRQRQAADLPCGGVPAEQRHRPHRADARIAAQAADKAFAAPDRAVRAEAGAVPDQAEGRARELVIGQAGGHVRPVVLHAQQRHTGRGGAGFGFMRGAVIGVGIADKAARFQREKAQVSL